MDIFEFTEYKEYVLKWVLQQPSRGRGQFAKMAQHCDVSTVLISQIFKGNKNLSLEQAYKLSQFLKHTKRETDYFLTLVQWERAGDMGLKNYYSSQRDEMIAQSLELKNRFTEYTELSDEAKTVFYSDWIYSAIRILTGIPGYDDINQIAKRLDLPQPQVSEAVEFLLAHGLCVLENGKLDSGPQKTHLHKNSPLIKSRQISWRMKSIEAMDKKDPQQLFFTAPLSISKKDIPKVKKALLEAVDNVAEIVKESGAEELLCLNIDYTIV